MIIRHIIFFALVVAHLPAHSQTNKKLPAWNEKLVTGEADWLLKKPVAKAEVYQAADKQSIILFNGLLKREFILKPDLACIDFRNLTSGQQLLRAISPEAMVTINGQAYAVGGLAGQKEKAYFVRSWLPALTSKAPFNFVDYSVSALRPFLFSKALMWPNGIEQPTGKMVTFRFESQQPSLSGIIVNVHYELYDNIPLLVKWISVQNSRKETIVIGTLKNEILALVEEESAVVGKPEEMKKQHGIYVETNYAFNNAMRYDISDQTTHWKTDSTYTSQVNYGFDTPCVLEVYPDKVVAVDLKPGELLNSVRTHELLMDSYDRERRGLAIRKMYRTIAPWVTQNPIFMHLVSRTDEQVVGAIDQCSATGYEAVIMSFGSHCDMEDTTQSNVARWKKLADYAHSKKVKIGSYSLFSSRRISDEHDVVDPKTGKPGGAFFGHAPCFGSVWGLAYSRKMKTFISQTGFDIWENDGPYPGDVCASTKHPGHKGLGDSQWRQMEIQKELYHWLSERGVYINAPDWYFLDGTHKIGIGYREVNFSLSREQQKILNRQNIFDGTWEKTPSMGWGFVPLTQYQGGGADAVLEPLDAHRKDYEQLMMQYYGAGVQACYRGPRLYDTDSTKAVVKKVIDWYKTHREILNADIIHLRRPDGRDWDGIIHVDPYGKQKAFVMLFNPSSERLNRTVSIPLYYSGLDRTATVKDKDGTSKKYTLNRNYEIELPFSIEAGGNTWFVIE